MLNYCIDPTCLDGCSPKVFSDHMHRSISNLGDVLTSLSVRAVLVRIHLLSQHLVCADSFVLCGVIFLFFFYQHLYISTTSVHLIFIISWMKVSFLQSANRWTEDTFLLDRKINYVTDAIPNPILDCLLDWMKNEGALQQIESFFVPLFNKIVASLTRATPHFAQLCFLYLNYI